MFLFHFCFFGKASNKIGSLKQVVRFFFVKGMGGEVKRMVNVGWI